MIPVVLALTLRAAAADRCAPYGDVEFRQALLALGVAVQLDDPANHDALVEEMTERLPCASFPVSRQLWATYLVHLALARFAHGEDWETALTGALRDWPQVDRRVGPGHPMFAFVAPPVVQLPAPPAPLPPGVLLQVDGDGAITLPPADGIHLVQRTDGRWWTSLILEEQPAPDWWLRAPIQASPHTAGWVTVAAGGGMGGWSQTTRPPADYYPSGSETAAAGELDARGRVAFSSPFGLAGSMALPLPATGEPAWPSGRAGILIVRGPLWLSGGAGMIEAIAAGGEGSQRFALAFPSLAVGARVGRAWTVEGSADGGAVRDVRHASGEVELLAPGARWRMALGVRAEGSIARLEQRRAPVQVTVSGWNAVATLGLAWSTE